MIFSTTIVPNHEISIGASPQNADLAIVPIDSSGTLGKLNQYVLEEYGYSAKDLPTEERLRNGFAAINTDGKKPILFVVTVNSEKTSINLETNLYNTLTEFQGWYRGKKVWIPLMGSGTGGLELVESFTITARAINKALENYPAKVSFILSLPDSPTGRKLFSELRVVTSNQHIEAKKFLSGFDCNFFLVGSFWGADNDQTERFIEKSIWEKGHDDETYSPIINDVRKGDILIIKSTFARNGISYLKIKAVGIVIENLLNGRELNVNWRIKGLSQDIQDLGHYRSTITQINLTDTITIFSNIDSRFWDLLSLTIDTNTATTQAPISLPAPNSRIAGLISDTEKGTDYLDISKDVTAFARVIAAKSFDPPLAIALLGKWGSGKSFFMRKLKQQVTEFSNFQASNLYCKGVAHIHFNAWSYMDANLWASIVSKIFEGLSEYISENSLPGKAKQEIEQELSSQLFITKEEIGILENKKDAVKKKISELEVKRTEINKTLESQINKVKSTTLWEILQTADKEFNARDKIVKALNENPSYVQSEADLKEIIPEKYWSNPEAAYQQIKSKYTFLREFFRNYWNLLWLAIILLVIGFIPPLLELSSDWIKRIDFLIPQATLSILVALGVIWKRAENIYNKLKPVIASFWTIKEDYERKVKEAVYKFEQDEKLLKFDIEKKKT
ncbi:P-loop NTPase fold protein [Chitinophaga barathri]|uniref:KAP NTPase domain-containing protein n=1 Tax=Chitinophaga barathri TaxID=1647451 RepID=A0A3N4M7Y2_9BACT|nr:P-loop NTPase fold protein [Chitinophaga barathri]RPD39428.1 hypothetical protein EG028_20110 [Chitinophaga barathri]